MFPLFSFRARVLARHRRAIAAGLAVIGLAATGASAWADGAIKGFPQFYESEKTKLCSTSFCSTGLALLPSGALLQATHAHCIISTVASGPVTRLQVDLTEGPLSDPKSKNSFLVNAANPESNTNIFIFNQEIRSFFAAQTRPIFSTSASDATEILLACKLSGDLVRP